MAHLETCAEGIVLAAREKYGSDHTDGTNHTRWSGWPGAYCLDCGSEDPVEICLADCLCSCHDAFYKEYAEKGHLSSDG